MFESLSYTSKDITAIREEIIDFIKQYNEDWVDFNESSIQMQYTEMLAGVADMLCYYLDNQALETFLSTARQKKNINAILKTLNYTFEVIGPSMGYVTFTRLPHEEDENGNPVYGTDRYHIPKYLELWTDDKIKFLTSEETILPDDQLSIDVPIIQGIFNRRVYPLDTVRQSFKLQVADHPVPLEYVEIENPGYTKVEDAFVLVSGGPYYSVHNDSYNNVYILFTFDYRNYLPVSGDIIVNYVDTAGSDGNVGPEVISHYGDGIYILDADTTDVDLRVINPSATYGGYSEEDVDYKRHQANAMDWLRTHNTVVLLSDFETMIRRESWVLDCACFDWRKDDTIVQYPYQVKGWVVTREGPDVTEEELKQLAYKIQERTVIMNRVEIFNAEYVPLQLEVLLYVDGTNMTNREKVRATVEEALEKWYLWKNYKSINLETRLCFGLKISKTKLEYDIAGLASSINKVELSIEEDMNLTPIQFLYCDAIKVKLAS